jgi:hypothetical protein
MNNYIFEDDFGEYDCPEYWKDDADDVDMSGLIDKTTQGAVVVPNSPTVPITSPVPGIFSGTTESIPFYDKEFAQETKKNKGVNPTCSS